MVKYTEEQLFEIQDQAFNPKPEVLEAFNKLVEAVKEHNEARAPKKHNGDTYIDEYGNERPYTYMNRRRGSRTGTKPNLRKKTVETTVDEDGWATLTKAKKSFGAEDERERDQFREENATAVRVKPNNKNLGSSKAADPRDAIAEKQTITFNAFEALGADDDDDDN